MPDRLVVAEFPSQQLDGILQVLRESLGLLTSHAPIGLQLSETGLSLTAAAGGTAVEQSRTTQNFEDARIDQVRLVGYGKSSGAGDSLRLRDVTGSATTLCTVSLPQPNNAYFAGSWTDLVATAGSRQLLLEVMGNGARTQVLTRVELQMRTLKKR